MDYNTLFNSNGKIATESTFFETYSDVYTGSSGIVDGFKTVLGEQIIHVRQAPRTPIYSMAISAPLKQGDGWVERLTNPSATYPLKPKATAQEALGFYDSTGVEAVFQLNFAGSKTVTTDTDLEVKKLVMDGAKSGEINDILVDAMQKDVQKELESMAGLKLVSTIAKEATMDMSTMDAIREGISDIAIDMKTSGSSYSDMARDTEYADDVVVLMTAKLARKLSNSQSVIFNPSQLNIEADVIPIYGELPTPITTAQYTAGGWTEATPSTPLPSAIDEAKPDLIIMDKKYFEIRPYQDEWKMTSDRNGLGDFINYHILYSGAMGYKPWRNAVRVYAETPETPVA